MTQQAQDLMMGAPAPVDRSHLDELHLDITEPSNGDNPEKS